MIGRLLRWVAVLFAAALLPLGAPAVEAKSFAPGSTCFAADPQAHGFRALSDQPARWTCDPEGWSIAPERVVLRFDLTGMQRADATRLTTRLTGFKTMTLTLADRTGRTATVTYKPDDLRLASNDWLMSAALPPLERQPAVLWAEISEPRNLAMLVEAQVGPDRPMNAQSNLIELFVALLCGILLAPFVFNIAFYRVLRERFLLWHSIVIVCMVVHTAVASGLINHLIAMTVTQVSILSVVSWSIGMAAAGAFIISLVEPEKLDPWHKRTMHGISALTIASAVFYLFASGPLRAFATPVFVVSFFPILLFFPVMMVTAYRRDSRVVGFQMVAWLPIILIGAYRAFDNLGPLGMSVETMLAQHAAVAFQIMVTSLGVADRFMTIKRQRDRALAATRTLEHEAGSDDLTGLLNRRAVRERFKALFVAGFDTMAVIDLDHFKRINDTYGHAVGDEVLRHAAAALMPDDNTLAVRMGGEEFLLLLRGSDAVTRAEHRRRSITTRVAAQVPGLGFPVTASMGLVGQPRNSRANSDFATLYAHCDRLLYEAKRTGRNRTMSERIMRFGGSENQTVAPVAEATATRPSATG